MGKLFKCEYTGTGSVHMLVLVLITGTHRLCITALDGSICYILYFKQSSANVHCVVDFKAL